MEKRNESENLKTVVATRLAKCSVVELDRWIELKARFFEKQKLYQDAARFWARLLKRRTRQSEAGRIDVAQLAAIHYRLGLTHRALNDNRKSLYHLKYSVRLNSSEPRYYEAFGKAFLSGGHWQVAKAQFEKALKLDPDNVTYLRQYSWILLIMGRKSEALTYAQRAYEMFPNRENLVALARVFMELGKYFQARHILRRSKRTDRIAVLLEECEDRLVTTSEGAVLKCLRRGLLCDGKPFLLWDLKRAEEVWTEFCVQNFQEGALTIALPNVWAAALAFLVYYLRTGGERLSMDELSNRFAASSLEVWPRIKDLEPLFFEGTPQAA